MVTKSPDDDGMPNIELDVGTLYTRNQMVEIAKSTYQRLFIAEIDALMLKLDEDELEIKEFLKTHKIR